MLQIISLLGLLLSCDFHVQIAAAAATAPAIAFETAIHHFGNLYQNEDHAYTFRFKNVGSQPLKILGVEGT